MSDESFELEDGELIVDGASSPADDDGFQRLRARLDRVAMDLRHLGQESLARLAVALVELADHRDVMWVLNDEVRDGDFSGDPGLFQAFRRRILQRILNIEEYNSDEEILFEVPLIVLLAAEHAVDVVSDDETTQQQQQPYGNGGFGAVPASAAAVRSLEKQTFPAAAAAGDNEEDAITQCSICLVEFVDGAEVTVMPCPSRVHKFHPDCISKWLAISNVCPLCRHELPSVLRVK